MLTELDTIYVSTHFMPAFINCDSSGLDDEDEQLVQDFENYLIDNYGTGSQGLTWDYSDESSFEICSVCKLESDCYEVTLYK